MKFSELFICDIVWLLYEICIYRNESGDLGDLI